MIRRLAALLLSLAVLAGCAQPASTPSPSASTRATAPATIGLTYIPNIQFAPFYVADAQGYFAAEGIDAKLRHHGASEGLFNALTSGQEDFVIAGGDELAQAAASGMDLVAIASYYRRYPVVAIVPEASSIKNAVGLKGKRVGVPGRFGETWLGLQALLKSAGLKESDITVVEVGYTQQAALTGDKVDAIMGFANNDQVQFEQAKVRTRVIPLSASEPPLVSIQLITTHKYLAAHPDTARGVADAMVSGMQQTATDPAGAVHDSLPWVPTLAQPAVADAAEATLEATIELFKGADGSISGRTEPERFATMVDFLQRNGLITKAVDPETIVASEVVTK